MPRIKAIDPTEATGKAKQLLDGVQAKFGRTPNLIRTMAQSPAALEGYLKLRDSLNEGSLGPRFGQQVGLTISQANSCAHMLAAHSFIGKQAVGIDDVEIGLNRQAKSADKKTAAGLEFARRILEEHGAVTEEELAGVRAVGFTDGEITEIVGHVALNILTNYFDRVAEVELDFPKVPLNVDQSA